jgi:hypothetical protein
LDQALVRLDEIRATLGDKLGFTEAEAAALLGIESHVLRGERHRKRVKAFVIAGGRVRYRREDLIAYLTRQEWTQETARKSGWPAGKPRLEKNGARTTRAET